MNDTPRYESAFPTAAILHPMGTVGPEDNLSQEEFAEIERACKIAGSKAAHATATSADILNCVDERYAQGGDVLGAQSAGGIVGVTAGRALIGDRESNERSDAHVARTERELVGKGKKVGAHVGAVHGEHPEFKSGCGASDNEENIFAYIAAYRDTLFEVLQPLLAARGIELTRGLSDKIGLQAQQLVDEHYAADQGKANVQVVQDAGGVISDYGRNPHRAVGAMLSFAEEVFDKAAFRTLLGRDDLQVFNADVWAFKEMAKTLYPDDSARAHEFVIAEIYFNVGTYAVLGNNNVRIILYDGDNTENTAPATA